MMSRTRVCLAMDMVDLVMVMESLVDILQDSIHLNLVHIHHSRGTLQLVVTLLEAILLVLVLTLPQGILLVPVVILQQVILVATLLHIIQGMVAWGHCLLGVQQQLQLLMVHHTSLMVVATMCLMVVVLLLDTVHTHLDTVLTHLDMVHTHMVASSSNMAESTSMVASSSMVSMVNMESLEESMECSRSGSKTSLSLADGRIDRLDYTVGDWSCFK